MNRERAWELLNEYTTSQSLLNHALCVEAAMKHYARHFGEDEEKWAVVGLLHDFDYEKFPDPPAHTCEGAKILKAEGVDQEIIDAVLSHAEWNVEEYPRDQPIRKALYAVDELCGFVVAAALVRPTLIDGMTPKSVRKKMKTPAFAAAVSRDDINKGAELLAIDLNEHIGHCIAAIQSIAPQVGLAPAKDQ